MSHPIPTREYGGETEKPSEWKSERIKKHKTIRDLKAMINQPASKEWFAKHGGAKSKALNKLK